MCVKTEQYSEHATIPFNLKQGPMSWAMQCNTKQWHMMHVWMHTKSIGNVSMYVCMYVCMYVSVSLSLSLYLSLSIYIYIYICMCMYMYVYACAWICVCIYLSLSLSLYIYIYVRNYMCMYVCMYVCMCIYIYIYIYIYLTRRVFHSSTSCGCSGCEGSPPETLKRLTRNPYSWHRPGLNLGPSYPSPTPNHYTIAALTHTHIYIYIYMTVYSMHTHFAQHYVPCGKASPNQGCMAQQQRVWL